MFLLIPYKVDVPCDRLPVTNWVLAATIVLAFIFQFVEEETTPFELQIVDPNSQQVDEGVVVMEADVNDWVDAYEDSAQYRYVRSARVSDQFVLEDWNLGGIMGHMWLHGGIFHLVGNMIFLWAFGNAICAKLNNLLYLPVYLFLGFAAAASHLIFTGGPAVGASGAINGLVGMYLIFFPRNDMDCLFVMANPISLRPIVHTFTVSGFWMILLWFAFDILGALFGGGQVAYAAHLGGFGTGAVLGLVLLQTKLIRMESYEQSIIDVFTGRKIETEEDFNASVVTFWQQQEAIASEAEANTPPPVQLLGFESGPPAAVTEAPDPQQQAVPAAIEVSGVEEQEDTEPLFTAWELPEEMIRFYCPCGKRLKAPPKFAGREAKCSRCSEPVTIPAQSQQQPPLQAKSNQPSIIRFACPCGKRFKVPTKAAGRTAKCPQCQNRIKIPEKPLA